MEIYDEKSCNTLEKLYYRPIEAALRWCNLIGHESQILSVVGAELLPPTGAFPQWPCLRLNAEKIWAAIQDGELPYGRDGKTVVAGETVRKDRITIKHTDLRVWIQNTYPDQKPKFLFDEVERSTHSAINADSFRALQADRDALKSRIEKAEEWAKAIIAEKNALRIERDALRAKLDKFNALPAEPTGKDRNTMLRLIGGLAMAGWKMPIHERLTGISEMVSDLAAYGVNVSEDTLRDRLREAAQLIEPTSRM